MPPKRTTPRKIKRRTEIGNLEKIKVVISDTKTGNFELELEIIEKVINFPKSDNEHLKLIFGDIENPIPKDKSLPKWGDIFGRFKEGNYPDIVPLSNPSRRNFNVLVYQNIKNLRLHSIAARAPVLPFF